MLMIESQRSYSEYSRKTRRLAVVTAIFIARWGIAAVGIVYFALITVGAIGQTLHDTRLLTRLPAAVQATFSVVFVGVAIFQGIRIFRHLGFEELVAKLPAEQLKKLLVERKFVAEDFRSFLAFELGVTFVSYCYASVVAALANLVIQVSNT